MSETLAAEEQKHITGRYGLLIPSIDASYTDISDIGRFFKLLYSMNRVPEIPDLLCGSSELVIPASEEKPLTVIRGHDAESYKSNGNDKERQVSSREILVAEQKLGAFSRFLTYTADSRYSPIAIAYGNGFIETFCHAEQSTTSGGPQAELQAKLSTGVVHSALQATVELLTD